MKVEVECYAGHRADERPLRFRAAGGSSREVAEMLDPWYGPEDRFFKVRADDGGVYILRHNQKTDTWSLDAYRHDDTR